MLKKLLGSFLVVLLIAPMAVSCADPGASDPGLVPGTANLVVEVQVEKMLSNPVLQIAYNELAKANPSWPQTAHDALDQMLQKTGLDPSSISKVVFFADIESTDVTRDTYAGMIASGSFSESALVARIEQQTQQALDTSDYKGLTVYAMAQDKTEFVFLSQGKLVAGTPKAVRDVVDVSNKEQPALSGSPIDTLKRFGPALIVGAFTPPANLLGEASSDAPQQRAGLSSKSFQDIDAIGFAVDQPGLNLSLRIDAHFSKTPSVQDAKDAVTGLISVAKGTTQDQNIKVALGNIRVSTTDSWLSIQDLASPADMMALMGSVQTQKKP